LTSKIDSLSKQTGYICAIIFNQSQIVFYNMKKTLLGILAFAALGLASCGEKLLTEAEMQAEITKGIEAGKAAIVTEEATNCDAAFQTRVDEGVAKLQADMEAEKAAAMPAGK
jgi:hypothetical protein